MATCDFCGSYRTGRVCRECGQVHYDGGINDVHN